MAESSEVISCVLIPLQQHYLILPNASIVETIPLPRINQDINKPDYWVGNYDWNTTLIPVINLDTLIEGKGSEIIDANKLCIIRTINPKTTVTAYALPTHGAPQLIQLNQTALQLLPQTKSSEFIHCEIKIGNKTAIIPNLDAIEATIQTFI
jgi:chemosensory pili system protein ChpC